MNKDLSHKNVLTLKDFVNLKKLLKNTSYVKLNFTVQMINNKCFDLKQPKRSIVVKDPLSQQRNVAPEINKKWFVEVLKQHWSLPQREVRNALYFLNKLTNEDIVDLVASDQLLIANLKQMLTYLVEREDERKSSHYKLKS